MSKHRPTDWRRRWPRLRAPAFIALFTVPLAANAALLAPADPLAELLAQFAQHPHQHARFAEQTWSRVLTHPINTSGELYFDAPDRLEKKTLTPAPEDLLVEGENVTVTRGAHRRSFRIDEFPRLRPLLEGLRATLAGDLPGLTAHFAVMAEPLESGWLLTLQPLPGAVQPLFQRIEIRGRDGFVQSLQIERERGEKSLMTISPAEPP